MSAADPELLPDYEIVAAALRRAGLQQCPAELHGFALGMAAGDVQDAMTIWQREVYDAFDAADVLANECRSLLDRVFAVAFGTDPDAPMALTLLLPQDVAVDETRLMALRDWVQGFLFGLGLAGGAVSAALSPQARELLADLGEIARIDTGDVDDSDANRAALIEIEEYMREGVILIRDELAAARRARIDGVSSED